MAGSVAVSRRTAPLPLRTVVMTAALGSAAGVVSGFVVGGIGGRLAMRLLAATSPVEAQGRLTDDGAVVGVISAGGTGFLVLLTTALGAATGLGYLVARRVLPTRRRHRVAVFAALTACAGGAALVHDHASFDFSRLSPQWLAVALFVALPGLAGALVAALVERWLADAGRTGSAPWWRLLLGAVGAVLVTPIVAAAPSVTAGAALVVVGVVLVATVPALGRVWRSRAVTVLGRVVLVVLVAWGVYGLAADVVSIATDVPSSAPLSP